ncbi:MAG: M48 family metallopeptidase [Candidatus Omnitrophota bacterium]
MDEITIRAKRYSRIKYALFFIHICFSLIFLAAVLYLKLHIQLRDFSYYCAGENLYLALGIFLVIFAGLYAIAFLPFDFYAGFMLEHRFNLSNQTLRSWCVRYMKQHLVSAVIFFPLAEVFYFFLKNYPSSWWIFISLIWIFFSIILAKFTPMFIIPLFYKLTPLRDGQLKERLRKFILIARFMVKEICEINLSKDTKKANAAFTGMGKTKRILLSDTLLANFTHDEVEVVLAHEIGHKKFGHIWQHLLFGSALTFLGMFILRYVLTAYGRLFGFIGLYDIANFPFILLYFSLFGLVFLPSQNAFSRHLERQADRYALVLTKNKPAFISAMEKLAQQNLADKTPPLLIEILLYDHPPISKRIQSARAVTQQ